MPTPASFDPTREQSASGDRNPTVLQQSSERIRARLIAERQAPNDISSGHPASIPAK